jgi:hypothetical protein
MTGHCNCHEPAKVRGRAKEENSQKRAMGTGGSSMEKGVHGARGGEEDRKR